MSIWQNKKITIITGVVLALVVLGALAWRYQQQGFIKIFPSAEERANKRILTIDRSKFHPPEGLTAEQFEAEVKKLEERRQKVLDNPKDAQAWFSFGHTKDFLNDHAGAAAAWEKSFALQPLNFVTAGNLGNSYQYFLKDFRKAEYYYLKALEIRADYTAAYQGLIDLYRFNLKEKQSSLEPLLATAIEKDSANIVTYLTAMVEYLVSIGNIERAKEILKELEKLKPSEAQTLRDIYPALQ